MSEKSKFMICHMSPSVTIIIYEQFLFSDPFALKCQYPRSLTPVPTTSAPEKHINLTLTLELNSDMGHCGVVYGEQFIENLRAAVFEKKFECLSLGYYFIRVGEMVLDESLNDQVQFSSLR